MSTRAAVVTLVGLVGGLGGCGYRTGELFRPDVQTVYVEMFSSKEFRRNLEYGLTEAIAKRISLDTPYRVAAKEKADTILMGEVLEERQSAFAPDPLSHFPREKVATIAIHVVWKDLRTGRVLFDQPVELAASDYVPPTGEQEQFVQQKVLEKLAQRVVAKMYAEW